MALGLGLDTVVVLVEGALLPCCASLLIGLYDDDDEVSFPFPTAFTELSDTDTARAFELSDGAVTAATTGSVAPGPPRGAAVKPSGEEDGGGGGCDVIATVGSSLMHLASIESRESLVGRSISRLQASPANLRNTHILSVGDWISVDEASDGSSPEGGGELGASVVAVLSDDGVASSINFGHGRGSAPILRRASM